jgi:hypothetical protein
MDTRTPETVQVHEFDDDACCVHCGFDGAEWSWLKRQGQVSEDQRPLCIPRRLRDERREPKP